MIMIMNKHKEILANSNLVYSIRIPITRFKAGFESTGTETQHSEAEFFILPHNVDYVS